MTMVTLAVLLAAAAFAQVPPLAPIPKGDNVIVGRVLDVATDAPLGGATVSLTGFFDPSGRPPARLPDSVESLLSSAPRTVVATAEGYFVFRDLPDGRYSVSAAAYGYAGNGHPMQIVEVSGTGRPPNVVVRLWKHGSISGTVVDDQGEPVVGVPVTALRRRLSGAGLAFRYQSAGVDTDDRGMYRIAELPPGDYVIAVLATTTSLPPAMASALGDGTYNPSFRDMARAGIYAANGQGVRAGPVVLQQQGPPSPLTPDGRLMVFANTLAPSTPTAGEASVISLGSGESRTGVDVAIRFAPAVRVAGIVTGADGPVGNLAVRLEPSGGDKISAYTAETNPAGVATALTDAAGRFVFPAISPGQYQLTASLVVFESTDPNAISLWGAQPLTVGDRNVDDASLSMKPGIRIRGRVEFRDASGVVTSGTPAVTIGLQPVNAAGIWRSPINRVAAGQTAFVTGGDPPGRYLLFTAGSADWVLERVSLGSRTLPDSMIELGDEDVRDVVVTVTRNLTRVTGTVVDSAGSPDTNARVVVFPADSTLWRDGVFNSRRIRRFLTTSSAAFEFNGLPPGDYYVAAVSGRVADVVWDDAQFLETLVPAAQKFSLDSGEAKTLTLKTATRAQ